MSEVAASKSQMAVVTGGTRGLGRGVVQALVARGVHVIALARDAEGLAALARKCQGAESVLADAADELAAGRLLQERQPDLVVLCAGASALLRPLHLHSWKTFSQNWEVDAIHLHMASQRTTLADETGKPHHHRLQHGRY